MPFFIPGSKENAKRPKDVGKWCDIDYYDGLRDPRGFHDQKYDSRKGYGSSFWYDGLIGQMRMLIKEYHVHCYLELGCAKGFRVQACRMQGVEAWGVDISEYATSRCHPDMKRWILCRDAVDLSMFEDNYFDYVYAWDFMEHLFPDEIRKCLKECRRVCTGWLEYGITGFDKDYGSVAQRFYDEPQDPTHVSCYKVEWWKELFNSIFDKEEIKKFELHKSTDRRREMRFMIKLREDANG